MILHSLQELQQTIVLYKHGVYSTCMIKTEEGRETLQANLILLRKHQRDDLNIQNFDGWRRSFINEHRPDVCMVEKKASGQSLNTRYA